MKLYHGSAVGGIRTLEPRLADHGRPYLYLTTLREVAAIYLTDGGERPCYWFPYGYTKDGRAVYYELWPGGLEERARGRSGWIYTVEAEECDLEPLPSNPKARLSAGPLPTADAEYVPDVYDWLLEAERQGRMVLWRYEQFTPEQLNWWYEDILAEAREKNARSAPEQPYARLMREKFPQVWEKLERSALNFAPDAETKEQAENIPTV